MNPESSGTRQLPFYNHLSNEIQHFVDETRIGRRYKPGEVIVQQGQVWPYLFLVVEGEIHALKASMQGKSLVPSKLTAGDVFWGLAFFLPETPMPVTLQSYTSTVLAMWAYEHLEPVLTENGLFAWQLCQMMVRRMRAASDVIEELAFQPVLGRLAGLILSEFGGGEEYKARTLTLDEMAAHIGSTREVVCRNLQRMVEQGLIDMTRTELKVADVGGLERIAQR